MGLCCSTNEDIGMSRGATKRMSISANSGSISDLAIVQIMQDQAEALKQSLLLSFSCKDLPNLDAKSKSDCFVVLFFMKGEKKIKLGETECIYDSLEPEFIQPIET